MGKGDKVYSDLLYRKKVFCDKVNLYKENILVLFSKSGFTELAEKLGDVLLIDYKNMEWE